MEHRDDPLAGTNLAFIEALYADYLEDPSSVDADWHAYFAAWAADDGDAGAARRAVDGPRFRSSSIFAPPGGAAPRGGVVAKAGVPAVVADPVTVDAETAKRVRFPPGSQAFPRPAAG